MNERALQDLRDTSESLRGVPKLRKPKRVCRSGGRNPGSPGGIRTREWPAPIWQAIAGTFITGYGIETAPSELDAALWLAAHEDDKVCALAGLRTQRLVRDDQRRSWRRHSDDTIQDILRNGDPVECCFRTCRVGRR